MADSTAKKLKAELLTKAVIKNNGNQSAVARELGVTRQTIQKRMKQALVKKTMAEHLEAVKITDRKLAKKIAEGIEATKLVLVDTTDVTPQGKTIKSEETVPDFMAQHKFITTALQLKGHIKDGAINAGGDVHIHKTTVFQSITDEEIEGLDLAGRINLYNDRISKQRG